MRVRPDISGNFRRLINLILRGITSPLGQKVMLFVVFIFIAGGLWLLNALGRRYSAEIKLRVEYTNLPPNKILIGDLPKNLRIGVTATGYNIIRYRLGALVNSVNVGINSFAIRKSSIGDVFYLPTEKIKGSLDFQLPNIAQVNYVLPDTLYYRYTEARRKHLKVIPDVKATFKRQYMQKGQVVIEPDSVWVSGPSTVVDTLKTIRLRPVIFREVEDKAVKQTTIESLPYTTFGTNIFELTLKGEKYTESSVKVPLMAKGVPDSLRLRTFPAQVNVTFIVCLSDYEQADATKFEASVRYSPDLPQLKVVLSRHPVFVKIRKVEPATVDYLIELR